MISRLKELRFYKEKTQLQVQMETGIEQALLSKYENGLRIPPTDTLMILADYYGVSMDYIMGRTDNTLAHGLANYSPQAKSSHTTCKLWMDFIHF